MRIAVITAIYGPVDPLRDHRAQELPPGWTCDWFCFTDQPFVQEKKSVWKLIYKPYHESVTHPKMNLNVYKAKFYRMQNHKVDILQKYDCYVWLDGHVGIGDPDFVGDIVKRAGEFMAMWPHPNRECLYKEAYYSLTAPKYKDEPIRDQIATYEAAGMPHDWGLWCAGMSARRVNPLTNRLWDEWWNEILQWSFQDQVALPYIFWKNNRRPFEMPDDVRWSKYGRIKNHLPGFQELNKR